MSFKLIIAAVLVLIILILILHMAKKTKCVETGTEDLRQDSHKDVCKDVRKDLRKDLPGCGDLWVWDQ
jgi:hypothetical protein